MTDARFRTLVKALVRVYSVTFVYGLVFVAVAHDCVTWDGIRGIFRTMISALR